MSNNALSTQVGQSMPFADMERLAGAITGSGLFGIKTPEQALALMAICQADGIHPAKAAQMYHIIQGRAALKADAMLARFQQAGGKVQWITATDKECEAEFSHPAGGTTVIKWTLEDAKRAKLTGKDNWNTYPRQMLRARVISEGVRATYPGVVTGFYTPEEVSDYTEASTAELRSAITGDVATDAAPPAKREKVATVTGEVKTKIPTWEAAQTEEAGRIRARLIEIGGDAADKELRALMYHMKYDTPEDQLNALSKLKAKWEDIHNSEPVVVTGLDEGSK